MPPVPLESKENSNSLLTARKSRVSLFPFATVLLVSILISWEMLQYAVRISGIRVPRPSNIFGNFNPQSFPKMKVFSRFPVMISWILRNPESPTPVATVLVWPEFGSSITEAGNKTPFLSLVPSCLIENVSF